MFKFKVQSNSELRRFSADPTNLAEITKRAQGLLGLSELPRLEIACPDGSLTPLVDLGQLQSLSSPQDNSSRLLASQRGYVQGAETGASQPAQDEQAQDAGAATAPVSKAECKKAERQAQKAERQAQKAARQAAKAQERALSGDHLIEDKPSRGKGELRAEKLALREARLAGKVSRRAERDTKKAERA
eukprot:CAMPEP_0114567706 /NCGR_PEP_ID=MMETSP0114-20121206/15630_1 /TAXON_ID=31324 /ORGANISM="Goniomonas sp, Strain m" /LENGTH=187 /DNA_ID=CAMNT_0001754325 /DNA_START=135 /DNA_END=693 /DNA_ORIENTATION=-